MSDHPYVPQNSDTSHQDDLHAVQTTAFGRRRMVTALLHGHSRSETERLRSWPFAVTGVLATGLVAAGLGVANAYQDQQTVDHSAESAAAPPLIVQVPDTTPATPTITEPPSEPKTPAPPATKTPQTPAAKKPAQPKTTPKQSTKQQQTTKKQSTKKQTTKQQTKQKSTQSSPTTKPKDGSKKR